MREDLEEAVDVDAMIVVHTNYMKVTIEQALLGNKLRLIYKTVLNILDLGIKLEDARAANEAASVQAMEQQNEMMDLSIASLGLSALTPGKKKVNVSPHRRRKPDSDSSDDDDEEVEVDVDASMISMADNTISDLSYVDNLRSTKREFDRLVRFVAGGLRGVARASDREGAGKWDILAEMLEGGIGEELGNGRGF